MYSTQIDYSRKWYVMAAVSMGTLLATIDSSIVNVALPTMVRVFDTDFATVQWVVLAYLLTLATLLLSIGRLADMKGKKSIYALGFIIFTIGSVLNGLSPNIYWLIIFRVLQAIGATMILALSMAIVTEAFPPNERGMALGLGGTMVSVGIVIGPTLGGLILGSLSWHWIFFVNLPIGILGTLMVMRFVPDTKPEGKQRFDFSGAASLFLSLLSFLFALTIGQNTSFISLTVIGLFIASMLLLGIFIYVELHSPQPMLDLRLFKNKLFSINLITGFITFIAIAGAILLMPFYLENVLGYSTREVGILVAVVPIVMAFVAPMSGSLSDRFGTRPITAIGLAILLIGYLALSTLSITTNAIGFILRFLPIGIGMGVFQSPNNSAIMGEAPHDRLGIVSGMLAVNRTIGQISGIAILGAVWASQTIAYATSSQITKATEAPASAQVAGLNTTFLFISFLIFIALGLSIWALKTMLSQNSSTKLKTKSFEID